MITQQARIIASIDDYKLLMIATLAVLPFLIRFQENAVRGRGPATITSKQRVARTGHVQYCCKQSRRRMATMAFSKILLCYDSTREGRKALLQGAELAEKLGAETHLLAIADLVDSGLVEPSGLVMDHETKHIVDILNEGVERLKARGLKAKGHLVCGTAIEQIPIYAERLGVDLIVVGHKPCGPVARWWAGPGNAQLLDRVTCNILVSIDCDDA